MADLLYHLFAFMALFSYGLYHLVSAARAHYVASSSSSTAAAAAAARVAVDHAARPYYPLGLLYHRQDHLCHLPVYLALISLAVASAAHVFLSTGEGLPSALRISFFESAAAVFFFAILASSLLLFPLPADVLFLLAGLSFAILSAASSHSAAAHEQSELQSKCDAVSSLISAASAAVAFVLAISPRLFLAELALAASIALQGLWSLQTGLSLYVDAFAPEGCYRLQGRSDFSTTRCDLDKSRLRAFAILDLAFSIYALLIAIVTLIVYASTAGSSGADVLVRKHNGSSYEALPPSSSTTCGIMDHHIQMKAMAKTATTQA